MRPQQKTVAIGAVSGIVTMLVALWLLTPVMPAPALEAAIAERLAFALRWDALAVIPLFAMIVAVGNERFLTEAIDPTAGKESRAMIVNGRVADNTLQQYVLFLVGMLGLAVTLPIDRLSIVAAVAITFVVFRIVFWIGYRIKPLYRAPGFSSIAYMNLGMLLATLWLWLRG